ncbi:MAG: glycosyltransferase [bacterium]
MNEKKLNILQVVNSPHWHAISSYALNLSKGLKAKGHKVIIVTLPGSLLIKRAEAEGVPVITNLHLNHNNPIYFITDLRKLICILEEEEIDVLNVHESYGFVISCLAAKLARRPIALIRTRGTFMTPKGHSINRYLHNSLADEVIVTSKFMLKKCLKHLRGKEDHYKLIYFGIDVDKFKVETPKEKIRAELGIAETDFIIGMTARFDPVKGYPYFFETAAKVKNNIEGLKVKFLIIGYEAEFSKADLMNMAKKHNIEKDVIIIDKWSNLPEILSVIDIGVITSIGSEANSRTCLEFMGAGKPVVATTVGVLPEIIENDKTGYLVQPKDIQAMANVLLDLLENREKLKIIGDNGRKLVNEKFTQDFLVTQTEEIYYQQWRKKLPRSIKKILVIDFNLIGDLLFTTPTIKAIKQNFNNSHLSIVVNSTGVDVVRNNPYIDEIIVFDRKHKNIINQIKFILKIRKQRFDLVVDLYNGTRSAVLAWLSRAKYRVGKGTDWNKIFFNLRFIPKKNLTYCIEEGFEKLGLLGIDIEHIDKKLVMEVSNQDREYIKQLFKIKEDELVIVINPGAGAPSRRWSVEGYARVADVLIEKYKAKVILSPNLGQEEFAFQIKRLMSRTPLVSPVLNLNQIAALGEIATVFIGTDTGPLHIAAAAGAPVVTIFLSTSPSMHHHLIRTKYVYKKLPCNPCQKGCESLECVKAITAMDVLEKVEELLNL